MDAETGISGSRSGKCGKNMKMIMRRALSILLVMILCLVPCGCAGSSGAASAADTPGTGKTGEEISGGEEETLQIGMSFDSFVIERWIRDRDVFVSTAQSLGASVNVQSANGDVQEQIEQIRYLISKGVDVLVVIPVDCASLAEVIGEARDKGIKVISYDRLASDANVDLYVSFDNYEVGRLMAAALVQALPEGSAIFMIGGPLTDDNVRKVEDGFHSVLDESTLTVEYQQRCENWNAADGYTYVKEGLSQNRDVAGIMCGNDDIATQAFRALAEERLAGKVMLTGQDGDLAACQRVVSGTQLVSVFKSVDDEARAAAECAVRLGRGEKLEEITKTISDGSHEVPYLELKPIAVTKDNIDEVIIEGGFHARDEVYLQ